MNGFQKKSVSGKVCVVGNIGIDTTVYFSHGGRPRMEVEGNFTENRDYVGQAGGYTARGYAQLGVSTAFIGTVGDDYLGRWIVETLKEDGIDIQGVFIDPQGTARSINLMDDQGGTAEFLRWQGTSRSRAGSGSVRPVTPVLPVGPFSHSPLGAAALAPGQGHGLCHRLRHPGRGGALRWLPG